MTLVLKGAPLATEIRNAIRQSIEKLIAAGGRSPILATLLVGDDPSAQAYRQSIARSTRKVEIEHRPITLPATASPVEFVREIRSLNADPDITGILVLMPLPPQLRSDLILENLSPLKDVDGITPINAGRLYLGLPSLHPSTPQGGIELLDHYGIEIAGKEVVVIGRSNVVGRPLTSLLIQRNATVTVCHRQTIDLGMHTRRADIVAVAAGSAKLVTSDMVRPGATVLDFGVNVEGDRLVGDSDYDALLEVAGAVTPVPGGTGPVTAMILARNTVAAGFATLSGNLDHVEFVHDLPSVLPLTAVVH